MMLYQGCPIVLQQKLGGKMVHVPGKAGSSSIRRLTDAHITQVYSSTSVKLSSNVIKSEVLPQKSRVSDRLREARGNMR